MSLNCTTGKPCGNACITAKDTCTLDAQTAKVLNKLVAGANVPRVASGNLADKALEDLDNATTLDERRMAAKALMLRLPPNVLKDIEANIGAFADSDAAKGVYHLPGMKRRTVTDREVDAGWDNLSTQQKSLLFSANAGAPGRGSFNRVDVEWGNDTERMRKSMLKAMLEQADDDGNILDPWTGKELTFPADLDHIVPISKGGAHGGSNPLVPNAGLASENWVWIDPSINRNYKGDNDIYDTYALMKKQLAEGETGYNKALDDKIASLDGKVRQLKDLAKGVEQGILAHFGKATDPNIPPQLPLPEAIAAFSKPEQEAILKALDKGGLVQGRGNLKNLSRTDLADLNREILEVVKEETAVAAAASAALAITAKYASAPTNTSSKGPKLKPVETNKPIKEIMKNRASIDEMTDTEMHRVLDRIMAGRPGPSMADDVRKILNRAPGLPLKRRSLDTWAMTRISQKVPDAKALTQAQKERLYQYLRTHLAT